MPGSPAVWQLNLVPPVIKVATEIHWLHWMMLIICTVIFIGALGVMFYSIFKHRKLVGRRPAMFHESATVEIIWTIVLFPTVAGMALPAIKVVVAMKDIINSDLTTKATDYQWKWSYDYLEGEGEGISFLSTLAMPRDQINNQTPKSSTYLIGIDNKLAVPVNRKVRVIAAASDVTHLWMVLAFGMKQDAIPSFMHDAWFRAEKVGVYRDQCVELYGKEHVFMSIAVRVFSQDDYTKWADDKKKKMVAKANGPNKAYTLEGLKSRDEKVHTVNCTICYQSSDKDSDPFPALDDSKIIDGPPADHVGIVLHSKSAMLF